MTIVLTRARRVGLLFMLTSLTLLTLLCVGPAVAETAQRSIVQNPCLGSTSVQTVADLNDVRNNLSGNYCLNNDLDLSTANPFAIIGSSTKPFSGVFNGRGHIIRNLTITASVSDVGLFARVEGSVVNLGLINATVTGSANDGHVGILAGEIDGAIDDSYSTGSVRGTGKWVSVGGLVGYVGDGAEVDLSWSSATVSSANSCTADCISAAGGLAGTTIGTVTNSFATGAVACNGGCAAGGLIGQIGDDADPVVGPPIAVGTVSRSFATGPSTVNGVGAAGGLVGVNGGATMAGGPADPDSIIQQSYAMGPVSVACSVEDFRCFAGGLAGVNFGTISQSYAVGATRASAVDGSIDLVGGLTTTLTGIGTGTVSHSYWDKTTTGQTATMMLFGGTGMTTMQLQTVLPAGFAAPPWAITPGWSYPYFSAGFPAFTGALAVTLVGKRVFVLLPIGQQERSEYLVAPKSNLTSLAAVYTMIARAVGITDGVATLKNVKIDKYFWNGKTLAATWTGPVTAAATLGTMTAIGSPAALNNVIGAIDQRKAVILRGSYSGAPKGVYHYMLATLYTTDSLNTATAVIANDPFTGQQIRINPLTKKVTSPANFPLTDFTVNGYQTVTFTTGIKKPPFADAD